jgi:hypothetical protein
MLRAGNLGKIEEKFLLVDSLPVALLLAVRRRALAGVLLEDAREVALVGKAGEVGNFAHRIRGGVQQVQGLVEAQLWAGKLGVDGDAEVRFKLPVLSWPIRLWYGPPNAEAA